MSECLSQPTKGPGSRAAKTLRIYSARMHLRRFVWTAFIVAAVPAWGQNLCTATPTKLVTVMGGRLSMHVPAKAQIKPFAVGVMAAQPSSTEATRIVLDSGKKRMVIVTGETYRRAGKDFEQALGRGDGSNFTIAPLKAAGVKLAFALTPKHPEADPEAFMLLSVSAVNSDDTVVNVSFYINPPAMAESKACQALSLAIAKTITAGNKPLQDTAGERRMSGYLAGDLVTTVPGGYVLSQQQGPDFVVYHLRKVHPYGVEADSSLGIYLGWAPNQLPTATGATLTKENGRLLGHNVTWYREREIGTDHLNQDETLLTLEPGGKDQPPIQMHVFANSYDAKDIRELRSIADSLRLEQKRR